MSSPTDVYLPPILPYPIQVVALAVEPSASVQRGTRLLSYSFAHVSSPDAPPEVRFGTWDSSIEGTVDRWSLKIGDTVSERRAREVPAIYITEPCKHGIQLGGLCCLCGKDMTNYDYTGYSDASRASIQMTHLANGPLVSLEEAQRIEKETAEHLIKSRKLSLIVDLDQTIVHATVDPTVGEWIAEGEAWEARQAKKAEASNGKEGETEDPTSESEDEVNPNWEALKDVKKFRLGPEALGQPMSDLKGKGKERMIEQEGCMYYIKARPGWQEFLQVMATKYEMHVYTMGTRAYAEEVCAAIDPDGKIFGGRLLSRDESGSLTQKSLQRLFPCDQSMVVIIDDRADVWEWSPNLVKVIPYDFFVGIGDINSAFLPKLQPLTPVGLPGPSVVAPATSSITDPSSPSTPPVATSTSTSTPSDAPVLSETAAPTASSDLSANEEAEIRKNEILTQNTLALEAQVEERPLARKQEQLQEATEGEKPVPSGDAASGPTTEPQESKKEKPVRKALLKNDDRELVRVQQILDEVHQRFYEAYDTRPPESKGPRRKNSKRQELQRPYDVRTIIPGLRMKTLEGVHILFSSVIPLDTRPEATEIWRTAHAFGAKCYTDLSSRITHVVAAKRGTVKVDTARKQGGIKIVWLSWFTDSIALWQRQDETPYLMDPEPASQPSLASPPSDPHQISSDPEPDTDDWDEERAPPEDEQLELDEVDWDEMDREVEAAMNESDDESVQSGVQSENVSEDEDSQADGSNVSKTSSPHRKRKRLHSLTPSELGLNGLTGGVEELRSPLTKRKKLVEERSGTSKLKEVISAEELPDELRDERENDRLADARVEGAAEVDEEGDDDGEEDEDGDMDEEDDFLARELEEEWG
ncbi:hypothetical protein OBBRIDRAFT_787897 [Obba rivulosa]|uniref:RNA polymerase II subunit A C-terminal domain phosphatase n=1 Tax=Obba rivulosa TaxID=1052685 RepID=A0A8E2J7V8_9APHY|nr:hypothetical protein OBBRIDRAFT_787897 [Obba rivulosa]